MRAEAPRFKRCCFCLPLRRGLIGCGYAKLIINILMIAYIVLVYCLVSNRYVRIRDVIILSVVCVFLITDAVFNTLFVVAGHRKSVKLLNVSYIYNIVALVIILLAHCFKIYLDFKYLFIIWQYVGFHWYHAFDLAISSGLTFCVIFVQLYFILLIRSEMIKLRHQTLEMQFSNHLASGEPQCSLHNAMSVADQCTGKDAQVVQECTAEDARDAQDYTGENAAVDHMDGQSNVTNFVTDSHYTELLN